MGKILIIEDEGKISRFMELELIHEGYEVEKAYDGRTGYHKALQEDVELIVLDLMLPELSGIEVCRRVRQTSQVPIIMVTAKDEVSDKVTGLDIGADDYLTKPFAIEELLARIRNILKRKTIIENKDNNCILFGKLKVDKDKHTAYYDDNEVVLTKREFELLLYLLENKNIVLTREKILDSVWGYDFIGETNIVDVYIRYLRSKIDQEFNVKIINTVRGVGYLIKDE